MTPILVGHRLVPSRRKLSVLIGVVILALMFTAVAAVTRPAPAAATPNLCDSPWDDEQDMADAYGLYCRSTWLDDPGVGHFLDRRQLLAGAGLYQAYGFSRQWLWYAPMTTVSIPAGSTQEWVGCDPGSHYGGVCPTDVPLHPHQILADFRQRPLSLSVFAYGGRTIARLCGNFFVPQTSTSVPVPHLVVEKYDDRNRNGARDPGEAGLPGWGFRIDRLSSTFGDQVPGEVAQVSTGADGRLDYRLDGVGPGTYTVQEMAQDGWAPTTASAQTFVVPDGAADNEVAHLVFGNAQTQADLVKTDFTLVDPPSRLEAHTPTDLTIRAVLRNDGPADVTASDSLDVTVPEDCQAEPSHVVADRDLASGATATVDFPIRVTCQQPSYHPMTFTDHLDVATPGVSDPDPGNNTVAFQHVFPVFDRADVTLEGTAVTCPERTTVGAVFTCTVSAVVSDHGPYAPVGTDIVFGLAGPPDCTASDVGGSANQSLILDAGVSLTIVSTWRVSCTHRSFHPFSAKAEAHLNQLHVEDPVTGNSDGTADTAIPVFEPVDLSLSGLTVHCTERENSTTASSCTATVTAGNAGPATGVAALATLSIIPAPDCTAGPSATQPTSLTLNAGATATVTATWQLTCTSTHRHAVTVQARIRPDEPHAEDLTTNNDSATTVWEPADIKPRSLPSSINIGKDGVVPFALLSTATLDAPTSVDRQSLRFGATGAENSVLSCAPGGEDVNDDGLLDLVCRADTTLTGITCTTTIAYITGRLTDGTPLQAEDDIKVTGCH